MKKLTLILVLVLILSSTMLFAELVTGGKLVAAAKAVITEVTVAEAKGLLDRGGYLFVDAREPNETAMGKIPGATAIPRGLLEFRITGTTENPNAKIVVYCKSGGRSALATQTLRTMGYTNVVSMNGGWLAWEKAGYPVE